MLVLKDIKKDYFLTKNNVVHALKGINLNFGNTGLVAILGQSGCGKTTLLNILGGLDKYTSGDLIVDDISTKDFSDKDWDNYRNKKVGMIFQSYNLIQHMNVISNVELALSLSGVDHSLKNKIALQALKLVGLEEQINKKPNQLSGGQAQRVAIARALVNNPSIILADEPTGALDSKTSVQIMELLKEISKEKLVIMVTHNRELASLYASRIIEISDGKIIKDSINTKDKVTNDIENTNSPIKDKKSSMSYLTAIKISIQNMLSKKGRMSMVSIAGSLGIIGIALILAISNGFSNFIDKMQTETLASYPISVDETYIDTSAMMNNTSNLEEYPDDNNINITKSNMYYHTNNITDDYINYVKQMDSSYTSAVQFNYSLQTNIVFKTTDSYSYLSTSQKSLLNSLTSNSFWNQLPANDDYILDKYDVISGKYPTSSSEMVLVISKTNSISDNIINALGFDSKQEKISFDTIFNKTYKMVNNSDFYKQVGQASINGRFLKSNEELKKNNLSVSSFYSELTNFIIENSSTEIDSSKYEEYFKDYMQIIDKYFQKDSEDKTIYSYALPNTSQGYSLEELYKTSNKELKIVGILRPKSTNVINLLNDGVYYSSSLIEENLRENENSSIAKDVGNHLAITSFNSSLPLGNYFPQIYSIIDSKPSEQVKYSSILTDSSISSDLQDLLSKIPLETISNVSKLIHEQKYQEAMVLLLPYFNDIYNIFNNNSDVFSNYFQTLINQLNNSLDAYIKNRKIVGTDVNITSITIYPKSFDDKKKITTYLDKYNENKQETDKVKYNDLAGTVFSSLDTLVNIITIVLVCFSSVSLVVSSVMIGIIMYTSVIERTKEIGILRSLGARKKDISRLFKTEALILGLLSGLIGIIFTYIVSPIINVIVSHLVTTIKIENIASLSLLHAFLLIILSMFLTYISALIPARIAAKQDPVKSLRAE